MAGTDSSGPEPAWRKAQSTVNNGACVEVATINGKIAVRDSKDPKGTFVPFTLDQWRTVQRLAGGGFPESIFEIESTSAEPQKRGRTRRTVRDTSGPQGGYPPTAPESADPHVSKWVLVRETKSAHQSPMNMYEFLAGLISHATQSYDMLTRYLLLISPLVLLAGIGIAVGVAGMPAMVAGGIGAGGTVLCALVARFRAFLIRRKNGSRQSTP
jgi:hypothetical protein